MYNPDYFDGSVLGISHMAHELTHVEQYAKRGVLLFLDDYRLAYYDNKAKGMSDYEAYKNIPAEKEANAKEQQIFDDLTKKFDLFGQPCKDFCK